MHFRLSPLVKLWLIFLHGSLLIQYTTFLKTFVLNIKKQQYDLYEHVPHLTTLSSLSVPIGFCEPVCTRMTQQCGDTCCILATHSSMYRRGSRLSLVMGARYHSVSATCWWNDFKWDKCLLLQSLTCCFVLKLLKMSNHFYYYFWGDFCCYCYPLTFVAHNI